ncbi:ASCH domain-containing protein [Nonomuraea sp. NEAU-A123]|uniref:ASCH domain-containing protein n=1 Tax=Nonomuraea sp. NEAU-A123 TaxID=2839649 RepID=UPI0020325524|nr:ASCH domain-containing protein [Nonomuraea sp. NEAU-A123]
MRMLTVRQPRQPWAALLVAGIKDVENRSWVTPYRGRLLIHAGLKSDADGFELMEELGVALDGPLLRGVILGSVNLVEIRQDSASPWAVPGGFHWLVTGARPAVEPMPAVEALGLRPAPAGWEQAFVA